MKFYMLNGIILSDLREVRAYCYSFKMPLRYEKFNNGILEYCYGGVAVKKVKVLINPINGYMTITRTPIY